MRIGAYWNILRGPLPPATGLEGMRAVDRRPLPRTQLGGYVPPAAWEALSQIIPKASIEFQGASKVVPIPSKNFNSFPGIHSYQWLTGERRQKNCWTSWADAIDPFLGPQNGHFRVVSQVAFSPACFEPIVRFPFFRGGTAVRRRSSHAPPSSHRENITRT